MRVYLPDGVVREMTLTDYQEFLVSYRITDTAEGPAVPDQPLCGGAEEGSRSTCVAALIGSSPGDLQRARQA